MLRRFFLISLLLLPACAGTPLIVGKAAPDFYLNDQNQGVWSSQNLKSGLLVLDFWASWCEPCVANIPVMNAFSDKYHARLNFLSLAVEEEGWVALKPLIEAKGVNYPVAVAQNNLAKAYGVEGLPTLVLIQDGKVVKEIEGRHDLGELDKILLPYLPKDSGE